MIKSSDNVLVYLKERIFNLLSFFTKEDYIADFFSANYLNNIKIPNNETKFLVFSYFSLFRNSEVLLIVKNIDEAIVKNTIMKTLFVKFDDIFRNSFKSEESRLLVIYIIVKSVQKEDSLYSLKELNYVNSTTVITNIMDALNCFSIFYFSSKISDKEGYKQLIFKILSYLVEKKIIKQILNRQKEKLVKKWSFEVINLSMDEVDYLKLSFSKFDVIECDNTKYLKGKFFTRVFPIFKKGKYNNAIVQLKDLTLLEFLTNSSVYIDVEQLLLVQKNILLLTNKSDFTDVIKLNATKIITNLDKIQKISSRHTHDWRQLQKNNFETEKQQYLDRYQNELYWVFEIFLKRFTAQIFRKFKPKPSNNKIPLEESNILAFVFSEWKDLFWSYLITRNYKERKDWIFKDFSNTAIDNINDKNEQIQLILTLLNIYDFKNIVDKNWIELKKKVTDFQNTNISADILSKFENEKKKTLILNNPVFLQKTYFKWAPNRGVHNSLTDIELQSLMEENKKLFAEISLFAYYQNISILFHNRKLWDNNKVFFAFNLDFRGRLYYRSPICITDFKLSRYFFNYGIYSTSELKEFHKQDLKQICTQLNKFSLQIEKIKTKFNLTDAPKYVNHIIFWLLLSCAKIIIPKTKAIYSTKELIDEASNFIDNHESYLNNLAETIRTVKSKKAFEKKIELEYIIFILRQLNSKQLKKYPIIKDATASFLQNMIRILGYKDEDSLRFANLYDSEHWYDTYLIIRDKWLEKQDSKTFAEELKIYTRSTCKSIEMTEPYGAKYLPSLNRFKIKVNKEFPTYNFSEKDETLFKSFFNYLKKDVQTQIFLNNHTSILEKYGKHSIEKNKEIIVCSHDSTITLTYYKQKNKTTDLIIICDNKKIRITKTFKEIDKNRIDQRASLEAIKANWVQNCDSIFLRDILKECNTNWFTVHDCFMVDILNISSFILKANKISNLDLYTDLIWEKNKSHDFFSIYLFF